MDTCTEKTRAPYRVPCAGGSRGWVNGPVHQNRIGAHTAIAQYLNVTKVNDWRDSGHPEYNAAGIDPFPREATTVLGLSGGTCLTEINAECRPPADGPCPAYPADCLEPCTPWSESDIVACVGSILGNCYEQSSTVDLSVCRKRGQKIVQARKCWHGRFPFDHPEMCAETHGTPCDCDVEPERTTAPNTKYLTQTVAVALNETIVNNSGDVTENTVTNAETVEHTTSINRYSGVKTVSGCVRTIVTQTTDPGGEPGGFVGFWAGGGSPGDQSWPGGWTSSPEGVTRASDLYSQLNAACDKFLVGISNMTAAEMEDAFTDMIAAALGTPTITTNTATAQIVSGTELSFEAEWDVESGDTFPTIWSGSLSISIILSNPYTNDQHQGDIDMLLAEWDLTDDAAYPWRTDNYVTTAPLVTYDEHDTPQTPDFPDACLMDDDDGGEAPWLEQGYTAGVANAPFHTGEIIGSPLPAGYRGHWDLLSRLYDETNPGHQTWRVCTDAGGDSWYIYSYGAKSGISNNGDFSDQAVPPNATQWTNNHDAASFPPGAWRISNGGITWAQKGAWIREDAPSQNFFRPCGADRETIDQSTIDCEGDEAARTGDLRWPNAWPICGHIRVSTAEEAGGTVTITLADAAPYLQTGDFVDFTDAAGAVTETYLEVTVTDPTHFTYTGAVPTGTHVKSTGAPIYYVHDASPKGQFVVHEWEFNYRDYQERDRRNAEVALCGGGCSLTSGAVIREHQATHGMPREVSGYSATTYCLPRKPCTPAVLCISPNGESFQNGITIPFGDALADDRYGARWHAEVQFLMPDLLWEAPHIPCVANGSPPPDYVDYPGQWLEDDGTCAADDGDIVRYYARRPYVEALAELPSGVPVLPSGIYIGWLSLDELDTPTTPNGNVAAPPSIVSHTNGDPLLAETEWSLRAAQEACVCGTGRFATEYEENLALCHE